MTQAMTGEVKLTQYSHGAGCGCKISPAILGSILESNMAMPDDDRLLVGNNTRDDAAVYDLGNGTALISTTDFFMPIVDDPYDFGRIASANAISDVYAMGGRPVLAIAILGWPVDKLGPEVARRVVEGSRSICAEAGISLAGGHSIDSPEPIFGLAVNGLVNIPELKTNSGAKEGDLLFLTKPLGIGIYTTAEKKGLISDDKKALAVKYMTTLNKAGAEISKLEGVHAITDVTGFGLMGHLLEVCEGSNTAAEIYFDKLPLLPGLDELIAQKSIPGGTNRNWASYGHKLAAMDERTKSIVCDPQTSGGLLIAVAEKQAAQLQEILHTYEIELADRPVGRILGKGALQEGIIRVV